MPIDITTHHPQTVVTDLDNVPAALAAQDEALAAHRDLEADLYDARAEQAAVRKDTTTPRAELAEKELAADKNVEIAKRRLTAGEAAVNRAAAHVRAAEKKAGSSDEGIRRLRDFIVGDAADYDLVRNNKTDELLAAIGELNERRQAAVWLLDTNLAARGANIGMAPINARGQARQDIVAAVETLRSNDPRILSAIARRLSGEAPYTELDGFDFTPADLSDADVATVVHMTAPSVHGPWLDTPPSSESAPDESAPKPKRRRARAL